MKQNDILTPGLQNPKQQFSLGYYVVVACKTGKALGFPISGQQVAGNQEGSDIESKRFLSEAWHTAQ